MSKDGRIWLSHTSVELLSRCPRCFWLQAHKKIRQPEGIVSRLANRFDSILKHYFDQYRIQGILPPMVDDLLPGILQNPFQESYFVPLNTRYGFFGKLDECLSDNGLLIPVDFKTSSSDPREKDTLPAYQSQIDDYVFLLEHNRKKTRRIGFLLYFFPDMSAALHDKFPMVVHVAKLPGDPDRTQQRLNHAIEVLDNPMPDASTSCPFCSWYQKMSDILSPDTKKSGTSDTQTDLFETLE